MSFEQIKQDNPELAQAINMHHARTLVPPSAVVIALKEGVAPQHLQEMYDASLSGGTPEPEPSESDG